MKTRSSYRVTRFVLMAGCTLALVGVGVAAAGPVPKVRICHFPPGNPANVRIITVAASAVPEHIAHHNDAVCADGDSDCCFGGSDRPSICTNFATDVSNCGACGHFCDNMEPVCAGGSCECVAGSPWGPWGDPYYSCDPSGATALGFEVCVRCDEETHKCVASPDNIYCFHTGICCGGTCIVAYEIDPENCGLCGRTCDIGEICSYEYCCVPGDPGCFDFGH